jgi:hypothetical protein
MQFEIFFEAEIEVDLIDELMFDDFEKDEKTMVDSCLLIDER